MFTIDFGWEDKAGMLDTNFSVKIQNINVPTCLEWMMVIFLHILIIEQYGMMTHLWKKDYLITGYLIDQNFYTVENTREDSITDDSYFTQWEREEQINLMLKIKNKHQ